MAADKGTLAAGRYRFLEAVGAGGMGRVWRGHDEKLDREVALKELRSRHELDERQRDVLFRRMRREAEAAGRLKHPGIVTVHEVIEYEGAPVIVMEFVGGRSLAAVLKEEGRLPVERVAAIGVEVVDALKQAHVAGVVHRDIKPDNILLSDRGAVLTDFGIAAVSDATPGLTSPGRVMGTPAYMSPEQMQGRPSTTACDLWSLGVCLYAMVEGRKPFGGSNPYAITHAVCYENFHPFRHAGPLAAVLAGLLEKDPGLRITAAVAGEALALHAGSVPAALPAPPGPVVPPASVSSSAPAASGERESTGRVDLQGGHLVSVHSLAFTPDGGTLATGDINGMIILWDVTTGRARAVLRGHENRITSLALSPDGSKLASSALDGSIRLWDCATGRAARPLTPPGGMYCGALAFSPDGDVLAAGSWDLVVLWKVDNVHRRLDTWPARHPIRALTYSPDGLTIAAGGLGGLLLLNAYTGAIRELSKGRLRAGWVDSIGFNADGTAVAAGGGRTVGVWDVHSGARRAKCREFKSVESVLFTPDGRTVAVGGRDTAGMWHLDTDLIAQLPMPRSVAVALSPRGDCMARGYDDGSIHLWPMQQ